MISKGKRFTFLVKYLPRLFKDWSKAKIMDINERFIDESTYAVNGFVYDMGQPAETFYIV